MFTIHHGFSQVSFLDLFHNYNFYSLQSQSDFQIPRINFEKNRVCTITLGPVIWKNKSVQNVDTFKTEITTWKPTNC